MMRLRPISCLVMALLAVALLSGCNRTGEPVVVDEPTSTPPAEETSGPTSTPLTAIEISLEPVATGFDQPLYVGALPGAEETFVVLEKAGMAKLVENGRVSSTPFLDLTDTVSTRSEQGLLGLAFSPGYEDNGRMYFNYTDGDGATVVSRFIARPDRRSADPASEEQLLRIDQPYANHNGGCVVIGPDGMLWIGMGDGGSGGDPHGNGQNPSSLLGKMLRIDVGESGSPANGEPYGIPVDNPSANPTTEDQAAEPEVWALGLRNPWRFSFDSKTGDLWIGDVGQNAWEEIDFVPAATRATPPAGGLNFGWNVYEATHPFESGSADPSRFTMPVIEYDRAAGQSVTGGYVYRGNDFPALQGVYLYGDFGSGRLWGARRNASGGIETAELVDTDYSIVSFGEGPDGELYVVDFGGGVYRVRAR